MRSFVAIVARYQDPIYRLAIRMSRNESDAEEISQETFLLAHRGIASFRGESRFATWLYRIAINQVLMRRRGALRRPLMLLGETTPEDRAGLEASTADAEGGADCLVERMRLAQRVRAALAQLDEAQRAAVVLRDLEGLSAEEAAQILGVSPDVVRQRAHRGRLRLREQLGPLVLGLPASVNPADGAISSNLATAARVAPILARRATRASLAPWPVHSVSA
jgi:RNA polymerase sigma-70 factor (ECF subfamily)